MDYSVKSLEKHREWQGKIEVISRVKIQTREDLSLAYTPGVAEPCLQIQKNIAESYRLTRRANLIAVVTDGTAVLGLGDIGPEAGMPVMEGKCALFKEFGNVDAVPLCVRSKDVDEIVRTISLISGSFGGINLEDISAPRCFEIEEKLKKVCDIPVFHDDQHGTAVVVAAAVLNSLKIVRKDPSNVTVVLCGAGSAGTAIAKMLKNINIGDIIVTDRNGILCRGDRSLSGEHAELARITNRNILRGDLSVALNGADVFIGVSAPGIVSEKMISSMAKDAIVFPMANPVPEIMPDKALRAGARIVGTGRSDFPNQINNVLAFPGIFRGALDVLATDINDEMKLAAAKAIAGYIKDEELNEENIIPSALDRNVSAAVARAVAEAAVRSGVSRI